MSEATVPAYTIAANARWFTVVYTAVTLAVAVIVGVAYQYGIEIPTSGASIGAFAGVALAAGQRFATKRDGLWTGKDRHKLALIYVAMSFASSLVLFAALLMIDQMTRDVILALIGEYGAFIAIVFAVMAVVFYGMARVMLAIAAKRGEQK